MQHHQLPSVHTTPVTAARAAAQRSKLDEIELIAGGYVIGKAPFTAQ